MVYFRTQAVPHTYDVPVKEVSFLFKRFFKSNEPDDREALPAVGRSNAATGSRASSACDRVLARFSCLYASRDERLLLFEDGDGHLVAVDSSRLV